jgi:hypothetical protein
MRRQPEAFGVGASPGHDLHECRLGMTQLRPECPPRGKRLSGDAAAEQTYQMDFGAKAADYVMTFMGALNWSNADRLYAQYSRG